MYRSGIHMYTFRSLLLVSLLSGALGGGCASTNHTVRPEGAWYSTATPSVEQEMTVSVVNTPETSESALSLPLNVMREIIVLPLYAVTTLLIATGDWLQDERQGGSAQSERWRNPADRPCTQEATGGW
jgi:hypothetical protein